MHELEKIFCMSPSLYVTPYTYVQIHVTEFYYDLTIALYIHVLRGLINVKL